MSDCISFGSLKIKKKAPAAKPAGPVDQSGCIIRQDWIKKAPAAPAARTREAAPVTKQSGLQGFFGKGAKRARTSGKANDSAIVTRNKDETLGRNTRYIKIMGEGVARSTDTLCWWCAHRFEGVPRFIPTHFDPIRKRFKVTGNFCSWGCARAMLSRDVAYSGCMENLYNLVSTIHGRRYDIRPAPPREALKVFGGTMTIEEFRARDKNVYFEINSDRISMDQNYYVRECLKK